MTLTVQVCVALFPAASDTVRTTVWLATDKDVEFENPVRLAFQAEVTSTPSKVIFTELTAMLSA